MASWPLSYFLEVRDSYLKEIGVLKPKKSNDKPYEVIAGSLDDYVS